MNTLLVILLWLQTPQPVGFVTGKVSTPNGMPAAGVRVYTVPAQGAADNSAASVLESQTQTDAMGRYKLEVPPGRYYVAAGSVQQPTYFPGTGAVANARAISVVSGATVESVDFSQFVAALPSPFGGPPLPPGSTGVVSGVIRRPDGSPVSGRYVGLVQMARPSPAGTGFAFQVATRGVTTDANGRYRITNVSPDTYYIATGYRDSLTFYPGETDLAKATTITTTPTTSLNNVDIVIATPPAGTTISGRVTAAGGTPAIGASVVAHGRIAQQPALLATFPTLFFPPELDKQVNVRPDGSFELSGMTPGKYAIESRFPDVNSLAREVIVADQPINGVDFSFSLAAVSGRVLWEDGSVFSDAQTLGQAALSTTTNPNFIATTLLTLDRNGTFATILDANDYRFHFRIFPDEYIVKSITAGATDLLKGPLHTGKDDSVTIEVRIGKTPEADRTGPRVSGRVIHSDGTPSTAERVQLCCFESPFEQLAARVSPDGSFVFHDVPAGRYSVGLAGRTTLYPVESSIEVGPNGASDVTVSSTKAFGTVNVTATVDGGPPPAGFRAVITFRALSGVANIPAEIKGPQTQVAVPEGNEYSVVIGVPAGYVVKSITAGTENLLNGGRLREIVPIRISFEKRQ